VGCHRNTINFRAALYVLTHCLIARVATLICPFCGHKAVETMPETYCQHFYDCKGCGTVLRPKKGDCCVYCSYADVKCPPRQIEEALEKQGQRS